MARPLQLSLHNHCSNTCSLSFIEDTVSSLPVLPFDSEDSPETAVVKFLEGQQVVAIGYPSFRGIK